MAGLVPAIHASSTSKDVDARDKRGHDNVLPTLRRLLRLEAEALFDGVAHDEFLDLAGHRHREFVDEFDVARNLVVGDLALAEAAHLFGGQGLAGLDADPGTQLLAVAIVSDAENLHVLNLGMTIEEFLDLSWIKVFAAADHHVLDAADNVAIALVIDRGEVAGMHPAVAVEHLGGLLRLVPIAEHHAVA